MADAVRSLTPAELLAAWRPESRLLEITAPGAPPAGERAEIRIGLAGMAVIAVIGGTVAGVRRDGPGFLVAITPDAASLPTIRGLLVAAGGGRAPHPWRRPPRYPARLPATVTFRDASTAAVTTLSLSEGGCSLAWPGPPPAVGEVLRLRVAAAENAGTICWRAVAPQASVGVQFAGRRAPAPWSALVAAVARGTAPPARTR